MSIIIYKLICVFLVLDFDHLLMEEFLVQNKVPNYHHEIH